MKILFVNSAPHLPQAYGGVQSSIDQLIKCFLARGHEAAVLCTLNGGGGRLEWLSRIKIKISQSGLSRDHVTGYPVYRSWSPWKHVTEAVASIKPDVVIIQHNGETSQRTMQFIDAFESNNIPCVVQLRNVELGEESAGFRKSGSVIFIANSYFTARVYQDRDGISCHVIPPSIDAGQYFVTARGDKVVFINPYPEKGVELCLEIARRCPDLPFCFVESWALNEMSHGEILKSIAELPNVELIRRTNDMRIVYGAARIVLAPSKWEEAWGRVASEAHVSGIPVVGSNRGGLPEAIGPGGVSLAYDAPIEEWVSVVRSVYGDPALHARLSDAAKRYAGREELNIDRQVSVILDLLQQATGSKA